MSGRARMALAVLCAGLALGGSALLLLRYRDAPTPAVQATLTSGGVHRRVPVRIPTLAPQGQVDVNTADAQALLALQGIGPALAEAILAERGRNGAFYYPEDLLCVKGIGEKTLAGFRDQLRFSAQP